MSTGKRTGIDFSQHEVHITKSDGVLIHHIKKPMTNCDNIMYINAGGVLAVTGDYGNWIFCREFHPNAKEGVSDGYWEEKLEISSSQKAEEFDSERTRSQIEAMLNGGLEEYGFSGDKLSEMKRYFTECLELVDDEFDYMHFAYRNYPSFYDHEIVVCVKKTKYWLKAVFDGFDEICRRMKVESQLALDKSTLKPQQ
jgi:hypothetical protein